LSDQIRNRVHRINPCAAEQSRSNLVDDVVAVLPDKSPDFANLVGFVAYVWHVPATRLPH
jgi:hypothetical protein